MKPLQIEVFPGGEIGIRWEDGREDFLPAREVRLACPCAECVDEVSGERILDPAAVPADVRPLSWEPVGNYAVAFRWSDGHAAGFYTHELLRRLGDAARRETG